MKDLGFEISVIIPVFNNEESLAELINRLDTVLKKHCTKYEMIFVDDGSSDGSYTKLFSSHKTFNKIRIIKLLKNYGQSNAIAAGLEYSFYDFMVIMDADLQDKPEDIPLLIDKMLSEKKEMVIAQWKNGNRCYKEKFFSSMFYLASEYLTTIHQPPCTGIFRMITRKAYEKAKEYNNISGTLFSKMYLLDISYCLVPLRRDNRKNGKTGYTFQKKFKLALDRLLSFSKIPIPCYILLNAFIGLITIKSKNRLLKLFSYFSFAKSAFMIYEYKNPQRYIKYEIESEV